MKMTYLWILAFATVCASANAASTPVQISEYSLGLEDKNDHFSGILKLTPGSEITTKLTLDIGSNLQITSCKYDGNKECTYALKDKGKVEITMDPKPTENIIISYTGQYAVDGLQKETIDNKPYYFASFANGALVNVLPCNKDDEKKFHLGFTGGSQDAILKSNIKSIDPVGSKVRLQDIVFIYGHFDDIINGVPDSLVELHGVQNYGSITADAQKFSIAVLKKMADALGAPQFDSSKKQMHQYLFPRHTVREINGKYFSTQSLKNYLLSDKIGAFREQSVRTDLIQHLSQHWFDAGRATDKWLNIGLSSFLAYYALDKWPTDDLKEKKFRALDQLVVDQMQLRAFESDGFASSLPLKSFNTRVTTYDGVLSDPILYGKGASIMRSVMAFCVDDQFKSALKAHAVSKTPSGVKEFAKTFQGCFTKLEEAEKFFQKWHDLPGYPVVHVKLNNTGDRSLEFNQEKFGWAGGSASDPWNLYLKYKTRLGSSDGIWMTTKTTTHKISGDKFDWIILDANYNGYYRVNYDMKTWDAIISQLRENYTVIDPINRAQIIDDIFSFARSVGNFSQPLPDYEMAMKLFAYLEKEKDYIPLKAAFNAMEFLDSALKGTPVHSDFMARMKSLMEKVYESNKLIRKETDHVKNLLRREVGNWACKLGIQDCVKSSEDYYKNITSFESFVAHTDVEDIIFCTVVAKDQKTWFHLFQILTLTPMSDMDLSIINALGCTNINTTVKRFLQSSYEIPKLQNYQFEIISSVVNGNSGNINATMEFLAEQMKKPTKPTQQYLEKVVQLILRRLNKEGAAALSSFVKTALKEGNSMRVEAESVAAAIKTWEEKKLPLITKHLKSGENRAKPIAVFVTLSAILPFVRYFLRY